MAENISKIILNGTEYVIKDAATQYHTINGQSITGGTGDITITGGGGSSYTAGTNIDITNDVISCTLNASNGSGDHSFREGWGTYANKRCAHAEGEQTIAGGSYSHAEGYLTSANGDYSHTEGYGTKANNKYEHSSGQYNVSNTGSTTFGNGGNTLFSVGNGTSNSARHNAFEIRQNGDIYITKDGQDVKLQDQLGGGGASITVDSELSTTSTNPVQNKAITNALSNKANLSDIPSLNGYATENWVLNKKYLTQHQDISNLATKTELNNKQDKLVSGTNVKTINGQSLLGSGDIATVPVTTDNVNYTNSSSTKTLTQVLNNTEEITFTLEDGSTVTKKFILG